MQTVPVEQLSVTPPTIIVMAVISLSAIFAIFMFRAKVRKVFATLGAATVLIVVSAFAVPALIDDKTNSNIMAAANELDETLTEEQVEGLKQNGTIEIGQDRTLTLTDDGEFSELILYDASENTATQEEQEEEAEEKILDNDF